MIVQVESLPDPVSEKVLGDGYAIDPTDGKVFSRFPVQLSISRIRSTLTASPQMTDWKCWCISVLIPFR
ncbi:MAG: hypothetical protein ACLTXT_03790 [Ruminococcus callidus]